MNVRNIKIISILFFLIYGCAHKGSIEISAVLSPDQQEGYRETITSQKKHFVSLAPYGESNALSDKTSFILYAKNFGGEAFDISTGNVSVSFLGDSPEWDSEGINVFTADELLDVLHASVTADQAIKDSTLGPYAIWGGATPPGGYSYYAHETLPWDDPAVTSSYISTKHTIDQIQAIAKIVLQPLTLKPGDDGGGLVVCDTSKINSKVEGYFHVLVSIDGEEHKFVFRRALTEKP